MTQGAGSIWRVGENWLDKADEPETAEGEAEEE